MQTFKNKLNSTDNSSGQLQKNLDLVLLAYRRVLHSPAGKLPAMVMFGRQIQKRLELLLPRNKNRSNVERQQTMKVLRIGYRVFTRDYLDKQKWKCGVVEARMGDAHYSIKLDDGRRWKRHIDQIRKINIQSNRNREGNGAGYEIPDKLIGDSATNNDADNSADQTQT